MKPAEVSPSTDSEQALSNPLFVDTAGWVGAADADDSKNSDICKARDQWLREGGILATTDYIIDETLTAIRFRLGLDAAEAWWNQIVGSTRLRIEIIDDSRTEKSRFLFFRYRDKNFSFTDCTSFVGMKELHTWKALTLDHHFRQMGFDVLPG